MTKKPATQPRLSPLHDSGSDSSSSSGLHSTPLKPSESDGSKLMRRNPRFKPNSFRSDSTASFTETPVKRPLPLDGENSKRQRKKSSRYGGEEAAACLSPRIWSEDDEVVLLKGFLEYKELKGVDPLADAAGFYDFIEKSLHVKVYRRQVTDKVRKLRRKYMSNPSRYKDKGQTNFALMNKIWGNDVNVVELDPESLVETTTRPRLSDGEDENAKTQVQDKDSEMKTQVENKDSKMNKEGTVFQFVGKTSISMGLNPNIVNVGLGLCSDVDKAEMEGKWKQLYVEESKLFLRRLDLARHESKMIKKALGLEGK